MLMKDIIIQCKKYYEAQDGVSYLNFVDTHVYDFADPLDYYGHRANALIMLHQYDEAIAACQTALTLHPNNAKSYSNVALVYSTLANYSKATPYALKAYQMDRNSIENQILLATCHYNEKHYDKALPLFEQLQATDTFDHYECELGVCYYYLDNATLANHYLTIAFQMQTLLQHELKIYYQNCIDLAQYDQAYDVLDALLSFDPSQVEWIYYHELHLLVQILRDFKTARKRIRNIEKVNAHLYNYCKAQKTFMSIVNGRYHDATNHYNAIKSDEGFENFYHFVSGLFYLLVNNKPKIAIQHFLKIENIFEEDMATLGLFQCYLQLEQYSKAEKFIDKALTYNQYNKAFISGKKIFDTYYQDVSTQTKKESK